VFCILSIYEETNTFEIRNRIHENKTSAKNLTAQMKLCMLGRGVRLDDQVNEELFPDQILLPTMLLHISVNNKSVF